MAGDSLALATRVIRTIRNLPTELLLGPGDGCLQTALASFDNLRVVSKSHLVERICTLEGSRMVAACVALRPAVDCCIATGSALRVWWWRAAVYAAAPP